VPAGTHFRNWLGAVKHSGALATDGHMLNLGYANSDAQTNRHGHSNSEADGYCNGDRETDSNGHRDGYA
jgi:hypothetical protein